MSKLTGSAFYFSETMIFPTWTSFTHAITMRYAEETYKAIQRLDKCKQSMNEPVRDYIDQFKTLLMRSGQMNAEDILNKFLKGLTPILYDRVMVCCPVDLDHAAERAVYFEREISRIGKGPRLNPQENNAFNHFNAWTHDGHDTSDNFEPVSSNVADTIMGPREHNV